MTHRPAGDVPMSGKVMARSLLDHLHWYRTYASIRLGLYGGAATARDAARYLADVSGPLNADDVNWLASRARALSNAVSVLEIGVGTGQSTCALALGCWMSKKQVRVICPDDVVDPHSPDADAFARWHGNVIRKDLVPYVTPVTADAFGHSDWADTIVLVHIAGDAASAIPAAVTRSLLDRLRPGSTVALSQMSLANDSVLEWVEERLGPRSQVGSLSYGTVES